MKDDDPRLRVRPPPSPAAEPPTPDGRASAARLPRLAAAFVVVLAFWGAGELLSGWAALPVPGSVVGMLLLTGALHLRVVPVAVVRPAAELLIRYMALFFVPPGVAVLLYLDLLRAEWLALALGAVVGLLAVLFTVGLLQQRLEGDA